VYLVPDPYSYSYEEEAQLALAVPLLASIIVVEEVDEVYPGAVSVEVHSHTRSFLQDTSDNTATAPNKKRIFFIIIQGFLDFAKYII
jgi:hypothetical protein